MIKTISLCDFERAFVDMNRSNNFTYEGKKALFEYLEGLEDDMGKPIELDVIALCCEYTEYENLAEFQKDYGKEYNSLEDIESETAVIKVNDEAFIIQQF